MATQPGSGQVVLVTGASTGLGLALVRLLLPTDHRLILTARASSLPRFQSEGIHESDRIRLRALDVRDADQRRAVVAEAERDWGGVDILVNNAGVAVRSVVEHLDDREIDEAMEVNFRGPVDLIRLVLPGMRAKRRGRIINISSVGGMVAMPTLSLYSASKFALEGISESLWYEVRPWGVHVSLVQPGFIRSDSFQNTKETDDSHRGLADAADPYHAHYLHMHSFVAKLMNRSLSTPEHVAKIILRTMRSPRPALRVPATLDAYVFGFLRRVLPRQVYHRFLYGRLPRIGDWGRSAATSGSGRCPG